MGSVFFLLFFSQINHGNRIPVFCTFDLKNAISQDYQTAYADLDKIGLKKIHKTDQGNHVVIPTTAAMGFFNGNSVEIVRNNIEAKVRGAFKTRRFTSEIFIVAGGDWAWAASTT